MVQRTRAGGVVEDVFGVVTGLCADWPGCNTILEFSSLVPYAFDATNGRVVIAGRLQVWDRTLDHPTEDLVGLIEVSGFPKLFDTLLTFIPTQPALNILTPGLPDGFRSADSLQVWTGNLRSMPDWSQAQPLACMAAQNPTPGQIVSVPDTLPNPTVGEGRYYLVASQSGADRRLGRQYVNRAFSAREPAGLPACQ
jgi:hypothetical protein